MFREGKRFYARLGHPEWVDLVETDDVHGFTIHLREGALRWMRRWLLGVDDAVIEQDFAIHKPVALQCSPQGQVLLMDGERSAFDLNREQAERLATERRSWLAAAEKSTVRQEIARLIGIDLAKLPAVDSHADAKDTSASIERSFWLVRKERVPLLARLEQPAQASGQMVVYVTAQGVAGTNREAEPLKSWLQQGKSVAVVDLTGLGATQPVTRRHWSGDLFGASVREFYLAYLNGRSIVSLRTEDLLAATDYLARHFKFEEVHLHAVGVAAIPALHAAALQPERFATTTIEQSIDTWHEVVLTPVPENQLINTVHSALKTYDLPDLVELAGGRERVQVLRSVDAQGKTK